MRKTKIVCTLGLVSNTAETIGAMVDAGMNVARFNFSHGDHASHKKMLDVVKKVREEKGVPLAALLDTKGPEIRLGTFKDKKITLEKGDEFILNTSPVEGTKNEVSVSFKSLDEDVSPGDTILIDDGLIELIVKTVSDGKIYSEVVNGGEISDRKGVNIPGVTTSVPYLSEQDEADIKFGVENGFDFIAASFVRNAEDILQLRDLLSTLEGGRDVRIISKIENADGVENVDEILRVSDGIMVARGDMGVEVPFEDLPSLQKMLIKKGYGAGKMVITATQMLDSMMKNPRPTRAEVTDVANAIYDGTSAIMLSGETAAGKYPIKAVETMAKIAKRTEKDIDYKKRFNSPGIRLDHSNVTNAISHATCTTAYDLRAAAIITVSMSGRTARNISKFRPDIPIIGCTTSKKTYNQLALTWGVTPIMIPIQNTIDDIFEVSVEEVRKMGVIKSGELVVITTGVPLGVSGTTNLIKVHVAGDILVTGKGLNERTASARICVAKSEAEAEKLFKRGDILVIPKTSNKIMHILKQAAGIVTEEGGEQSHAAIVGLSLGIPVLLDARNATNLLTSGAHITLDAKRGVVSSNSSLRGSKD